MKANRRHRDDWRAFRDDEAGVSEAIGYIITFGVSTIILVTSLAAFRVIDDYTTDLAVDKALDEVGAQVSYAITQAIRAGSEYPEGTFEHTVTIPRDINGVTYDIWLDERYKLYLEATQIQTPDAKGALGTVQIDILRKGDTQTLCPDRETELEGGRCWAISSAGEVTIIYGETIAIADGSTVTGVYFRTDLS